MKKNINIFLFLLILLSFSFNAQAAQEKPISFLQNDEEWGSELYSVSNDSSQTIAASGCGPTCMAMVLNYYIDESITPIETVDFALENNHRTKNMGTSWTFFNDMANQYNLEFLQTDSSKKALEWMEKKEDPLIICSMKPGLWTNSGHFILLYDIENEIAYINDPASTEKQRTEAYYCYMSKQCKQYFCFNQNFCSKNFCVSFIDESVDFLMETIFYTQPNSPTLLFS